MKPNPTEAQDRQRAFYLGIAYKDFVKRKAELLRQVKNLKEAEVNDRPESTENASA